MNFLGNQAWLKRFSYVTSIFYERGDICCERENEKSSEMSSGALFKIGYHFLDFLVPSRSPQSSDTFFSRTWGQPDFSRSGCPSTKRHNFWTVTSCMDSRGDIRVHISISNICDFQERSSNVWWPTQADTNLYSFEVEIKIFFTDMSLNHPTYVILNGRPPTLSCRVDFL